MKFILAILIHVCILTSVYSEKTITLFNDTKKVEIGSKMVFLYLEGKDLNFSEISIESIQKQFIPSTDSTLHLGFRKDPVWMGFKIYENSETERDWILNIGFPILDSIEIYTQEGDVYTKRLYGDSFPFSSRSINHRNFVIPMKFKPKQESIVWLKVQSSSTITVPLTLFRENHFMIDEMLTEGWHFLFYGVLFVMIFYNAFIGIAFRSLTYVLYSLSSFCLLIYYLLFNGHGFQYIWPSSPIFQNYGIPFFVFASWIFTSEFSIRFLNLKENSILLFKAFKFAEILSFFGVVAVIDSIRTSLVIQSFFGPPTVILLLYSGFYSWKKGNKSARFFMLAWAVFLLGVFLVLLRSLGFIGMNFLTRYTMQVGTMIELVFLSFALAERYKVIQEENVSVQKSMLEIQIKHSEELENKVITRTEELNSILATIRQDLSLAGKIQQGLLNIQYNEILKLHIVPLYKPISEVGGDYYSMNKLDDGIYRLFLGDATGHGVQAALITMAVKGIYDNICEEKINVSYILSKFNNEFTEKYKYMNALLTCIIIDIDTQNHKISYASAGHPASVLIQKNSMQLLERTGSIIGLKKDIQYSSKELDFGISDRIYAFTDGAFEQFNSEKEEFSEERLYSILTRNKELSIAEIIKNFQSELYSFLGEKESQDDITLIGIGYK
jgi:serine phosphatase RsbU (regulator of sigma subunit)